MMDAEMSVEAQLAVLRTKIDQLLELNKTRGEDHENRVRKLEAAQADYITRKGAVTLVVLVCTVVTAGSNLLAFMLR